MAHSALLTLNPMFKNHGHLRTVQIYVNLCISRSFLAMFVVKKYTGMCSMLVQRTCLTNDCSRPVMPKGTSKLMSGLFLQMTSLSVTCQMPESATRNAPPRNKGPALTPLPPLCPNITVDES